MGVSNYTHDLDNTQSATTSPVKPKRFVFVLLDAFSYLTFSCAIEALRLANEQGRQRHYTWDVLSETGVSVKGSNDLALLVNGPLRPLASDETLIVCGGDNITETATKGIVSWLRRFAPRSMRFGGMSTGAFALAQAGLLEGTKATLHWEYHHAFRELFPEIELLDTIYYYDKKRFTCAGCAASMDLMLHLIADDCGESLASDVADLMVYTSPRSFGYAQRKPFLARSGSRNLKLAQCLEIMNDHIEDPLSCEQIASRLDMSRRQLERSFRKNLQDTPMSYYTSLRLERARSLLLHTEMTVLEVGVATGFSSRTQFSRCYLAKFGIRPSRENGASRPRGC